MWSVHNTIELVRRGVPAVTLLSEDFVVLANIIAKSRGVSLRYVVFPRIIDTMPAEEIQVEAEKAFEEVVRLWSEPA